MKFRTNPLSATTSLSILLSVVLYIHSTKPYALRTASLLSLSESDCLRRYGPRSI